MRAEASLVPRSRPLRGRAMVPVSGGPSSALCIAYAALRSPPPVLLHFDSGNEHAAERVSHLAHWYGAELRVVASPRVPPASESTCGRAQQEAFVSTALAVAAEYGVERLYLGSRDACPAVDVGQLDLRTPLDRLSTEHVLSECVRLGVPLRYTQSCEARGSVACGRCEKCDERARGFAALGVSDPVSVAERFASGRRAPVAPRLVYLLGAPHSGSTLLSLLLEGHRDVFAAGELISLPEDLRTGGWCTCGVRLDVCGFWSSIIEAFGGVTALDGADAGADPDVSMRLVRTVAERAGATVLLDSSKNPQRLLELLEQGQHWRAIHLVRDGRALIHSRRKWHDVYRTAREVASSWVEIHEACEAVAESLGDRCLQLRYEDLVARPREELERLFGWLALPFDDGVLHYEHTESHHVRGNLMRYHRVAIAVDEEWRRTLSPFDLAEYEQVAGTLASRYGYELEGCRDDKAGVEDRQPVDAQTEHGGAGDRRDQ